jgi:cell division protein FtsW
MLTRAQTILITVIALLCVGIVMVHSADMSFGGRQALSYKTILLSMPTYLAGLAMVALVLAMRVPAGALAWAQRAMPWLPCLLGPLLIAVVATVYLGPLGHEAKGAARWIRIPNREGGLSIQPSEIAKWGVVLGMAWLGVANAERMKRFVPGLCLAMVVFGPAVLLIAKEDLGTAVLIASSSAVVLLAAGCRVTHFLALAPVGAMALVGLILAEPYRMKRLIAFSDPWADPQGSGFHMIQSLVAISSGGPAGRGLGYGLQKFEYLPEDRTDFLFAVVCEELGLVGALIVVVLFATLVWACIGVVRAQQDRFLKLLALGVTTTVGFQALINLLVVVGLAPTKGIALPLVSAGGTGWVLTAAALGFVASIDRHARAHAGAAADTADQPQDEIESDDTTPAARAHALA